ncbi:MAG: hypothetical protein Q7R77_01230 [Candidatus Daviesbacteria bacterium]|nr:hypothetical protein [Candidatus Daviesbacteria bacterium]
MERSIYRLPDGDNTLGNRYNFSREAITKPGDYDDLPRLAEELGFLRGPDVSTKQSYWQIFERPEYDVPNFPDGSTKINSSLALYDTKGELTHAILRTAKKPYSSDEFARDLSAFTRHFIKRPRLLGFPSKELTRYRTVIAAITVGSIIGGLVASHNVDVGEESFLAFLNVLNGAAFGGWGSAGLWALSERYAKRSISHPEQYIVGDDVRNTLEEEGYHRRLVEALVEAYQSRD